MLVMAVFAEQIAPYGYDQTIRGARMKPPSAAHWLGTDNLSRDMWSRIVYGARVSITVGFLTIALAVVFATAIGVSSAYFGGAWDLLVQRLVDAWLSFPYLIIILSVMAVLGPGLGNVVISLAVLIAATNSRVIRGATLGAMQHTYVEAARAMGCGHTRIIVRHLLPNITATVIILATIGLGAVILAESALSFLGFGVPPPHPSWGGDAVGLGPDLHVPRAVDGGVAGRGHLAGRVRLQHAGRRATRRAGPASARVVNSCTCRRAQGLDPRRARA